MRDKWQTIAVDRPTKYPNNSIAQTVDIRCEHPIKNIESFELILSSFVLDHLSTT